MLFVPFPYCVSERSKRPVLDRKSLIRKPLAVFARVAFRRSATWVWLESSGQSPDNRKPLRGGACLVCCLVYLSNETATPSRDVKKKNAPTPKASEARGKMLSIRPLLISASYRRAFRLSNGKERRRQQAVGVHPQSLMIPSSRSLCSLVPATSCRVSRSLMSSVFT